MSKLIYAPKKHQIVAFSEGSGDNLEREDYEAGYNDYLNYGQVDISLDVIEALATGDEISPYDAGMFLFNNEEMDPESESIITALLEYVYDEKVDYVVLS